MRSRPFAPLRFAIFASVAIASASASAIVAASGSGVTPVDTRYGYVGYVGQYGTDTGSGVAVGAHAFLTAGHVIPGGATSGTFTMGGTAYTIASSVAAPDVLVTDPSSPDFGKMTHVDLTLVYVKETLPGFYNIATTAALGSSVTMVGYGQTGVVASDGLGYQITGYDGNRHSGVNTLDVRQDYYVASGNTGASGVAGGPTLFSALSGAGDAAVVAGDSGGGWFQGDSLVGISTAIFKTGNSVRNYGFYNGTDYVLSGAIDLTDPRLRTFLAGAQAVPEPTSLAALGLGAVALLRRRRRG